MKAFIRIIALLGIVTIIFMAWKTQEEPQSTAKTLGGLTSGDIGTEPQPANSALEDSIEIRVNQEIRESAPQTTEMAPPTVPLETPEAIYDNGEHPPIK